MISDGSILAGILGLIVLIVFFFMASNISQIKKDINDIKRIVMDYGRVNGYGTIYRCEKCHKIYEGKLVKCPRCGKDNVYDS
jgi:hypothetical protein